LAGARLYLVTRPRQFGRSGACGEPFSEERDFPEWIDENFGRNWELSRIVGSGIAVHHGRIPRSMASRFVRLFNTGELPILICTSTLIEGVNTAAKSVLIYDKQIDRKDYDFFTFSNIRGRAGNACAKPACAKPRRVPHDAPSRVHFWAPLLPHGFPAPIRRFRNWR
jgi:hypothetical protein